MVHEKAWIGRVHALLYSEDRDAQQDSDPVPTTTTTSTSFVERFLRFRSSLILGLVAACAFRVQSRRRGFACCSDALQRAPGADSVCSSKERWPCSASIGTPR